MLKDWMRWLPLALVARIARGRCELIKQGGVSWATAFQDVLIKVEA